MSASVADPESSANGPKPILRLQEAVINRIAAGEIIHRPSSALKELLENSLDAGATSIRVTVKDGGMKLLQIQDNGCGIRKADLPILAERFTTSKITSFQDLERLTTYGFRGEALASISYVSHLSVVAKVKSDICAWKASYVDGRLAGPDGTLAEPKACAGNDGTTITVENLFYNTPTRLSALRGSSEEYSRILDVVTKYAVHNPHVSFTCKKSGSPAPDLTTPSGSTTKQAIQLMYGQTIAKDLLEVTVSPSSGKDDMDVDDDDKNDSSWKADVCFTSPNYQAKKMVFLLFINHRLVESLRIKKALETMYTGVLPKGMSPFVYLSLQIDPRSVDVNVHPTKREVHFLDEEPITQKICDTVLETLISRNQSRVFEYQTLLTGGIAPIDPQNKGKGKERAIPGCEDESSEVSGSSAPAARPAAKKLASQHKVRTSQQDRTLDSMFPVVNPSLQSKDTGQKSTLVRVAEIKPSHCNLASVIELREELTKVKHSELTEILQKHVFVGIVDLGRCLSLIQHAKKLYLPLIMSFYSEEFFYQLGLLQFGNMNRIKLDPPPPLHALVKLAVDAEDTTKSSLSKDEIIDMIVETIVDRREMLQEYFMLDISKDGNIMSIPHLLKGYTPNLDKLPLFLMRLGPQINWHSEKACFQTFLRELAYFYVPEPLTPGESSETDKVNEPALRWQIQHVLFPAVAKYLNPPKSLLNRDVVQVANLPELYRVFERC